MTNKEINRKFLSKAPKETVREILKGIAHDYGVTPDEILEEIRDSDEIVIDYISDNGMRRAVSVLMQRYGLA
jgi:hypothetical protein